MTLCEFYEYMTDEQNIIVMSSDGSETEIARYDGKNSIENTEQKNGFMLEDCEVDNIRAEGNHIIIEVNNWF